MIKWLVKTRFQKKNVKEEHVSISYNAKVNNCFIGKYTYIGNHCNFIKANIGRYCSIGPNVAVITGMHPTSKFVSTHPMFYSNSKALQAHGFSLVDKNYFDENKFSEPNYYITIGSDVWIGANVSIIAGITIGHGAIIATGAVVTKNVKPYTIVGGVPAKPIRRRFDVDQIDFLLKDQWWESSDYILQSNFLKLHDIETYLKFKSDKDVL